MTKDKSRRDLLRYTGTTTAALSIGGIAGCLGDDNGGNGDDGAPSDDTDTDDSDTDTDTGVEYPHDNVRLIIPFSEGGGTDVWIRQWGPIAAEKLGVTLEIDNVPGAASLQGTGELVMSEGDGTTIGAFNPPSTQVSWMVNPQDWDMETLRGIAGYARQSYLIYANPDEGIEDFEDLKERYASGELTNFGGQQMGGIVHVLSLVLRDDPEIDLAWDSYIGYDGGGPLVEAVVSGEVPAGITTPASGLGALDSGNVEPVVLTASQGDSTLPEVDNLTDLGYPNVDFVGELTRCAWAPEGTDDEVIEMWEGAIEESLTDPEFEEWLEDTGNEAQFVPAADVDAINESIFEEIPEQVDLESVREEAN